MPVRAEQDFEIGIPGFIPDRAASKPKHRATFYKNHQYGFTCIVYT